jgi:hypothetical protein
MIIVLDETVDVTEPDDAATDQRILNEMILQYNDT